MRGREVFFFVFFHAPIIHASVRNSKTSRLFEMFGTVFGARDWLVPLTANILTVAVLAGGYLIILKRKRKHVA